ncbi:TM2 domain-containing protein [Streptomyces mirabilis]|uniref:TM2 domain-containing protein n=1 Tax=Streptomyces mirabilis TaxID=68239 RepID=UPI00331B636F
MSIEGAPSREPVSVVPVPVVPVPARAARAERTAGRHHTVATTVGRPAVVPTPARPEPVLRQDSTPRAPKSVAVAYLWWFFLGLFGMHHFYLGRTGRGLLHLCTLGIGGLGWLADALTLPHQVGSANARIALQDVAPRADATAGPALNDPVR